MAFVLCRLMKAVCVDKMQHRIVGSMTWNVCLPALSSLNAMPSSLNNCCLVLYKQFLLHSWQLSHNTHRCFQTTQLTGA